MLPTFSSALTADSPIVLVLELEDGSAHTLPGRVQSIYHKCVLQLVIMFHYRDVVSSGVTLLMEGHNLPELYCVKTCDFAVTP